MKILAMQDWRDRMKVHATPTIFINRYEYREAIGYTSFVNNKIQLLIYEKP